jgi:hypothetical protein
MIRRVIRTERAGRNYRLHLACGHSKLHTPAAQIPAKAQCVACGEQWELMTARKPTDEGAAQG